MYVVGDDPIAAPSAELRPTASPFASGGLGYGGGGAVGIRRISSGQYEVDDTDFEASAFVGAVAAFGVGHDIGFHIPGLLT